jgi:hypothetical protein
MEKIEEVSRKKKAELAIEIGICKDERLKKWKVIVFIVAMVLLLAGFVVCAAFSENIVDWKNAQAWSGKIDETVLKAFFIVYAALSSFACSMIAIRLLFDWKTRIRQSALEKSYLILEMDYPDIDAPQKAEEKNDRPAGFGKAEEKQPKEKKTPKKSK